jgi:hypothetical protein
MTPTLFSTNNEIHLSTTTYYNKTTPLQHHTPLPHGKPTCYSQLDNLGILLAPPSSCVLFKCDISILTLVIEEEKDQQEYQQHKPRPNRQPTGIVPAHWIS